MLTGVGNGPGPAPMRANPARPAGAVGFDIATITARFDDWSSQRRRDGAGVDYMAQVEAARPTYLAIVGKAQAGGFADPVAFLRTLGSDELQALRQIHSLGDPVDPATLDAEGALNLLLPRTMARDLDGDGRTMIGKAATIVFPPGDAPQAVKDAWAKATDGMDFTTRLHLEMSMHLAGNAADGPSAATDFGAWIDAAITGAGFNLRVQPADQRGLTRRVLDALYVLKAALAAPPAARSAA
ncbi:MAG: hypothetical protein PGN09_09475 [Sphingomonas fennica]